MVASYHFGKEDTQFLIVENSYYNQFLFLLKGSLIVFAPMYFHFDGTISIFRLLLIENENFFERNEPKNLLEVVGNSTSIISLKKWFRSIIEGEEVPPFCYIFIFQRLIVFLSYLKTT